MAHIKNFLKNEDGAVTVDWVVLTGGVVALAAVVGATISDPVDNELNAIALVVENTTN